MPIRNGEYVTRDEDEIFETVVSEVTDENPSANPRSPTTYTYALLFGLAATIAANQELSLKKVYESAYIEDATDEELTKKARNLGVIRQEAVKATGVVTFSRSNPPSQDTIIPSGTVVETVEVDPIQFETTEVVEMTTTETSVQANVIAVKKGSDGNVGAHAIRAIPSPPIDLEVDNPDPTGDPTITDTNGDPLVVGRDKEDDDSLRERTLNIDASTEGPSQNGIKLALQDVDDGISTHINTNQDTSTQDGLDPYQTEVVVYGGDVYEIGKTLSETMSMTSLLRLVGGVHGTIEETSVYSEILDQYITVPITRPSIITFDMTIDVVHTSSYDGDVAVQDTIVQYVGGTRADNSSITGLGLGDNVLINEVENRVENVQGVDYADVTLVDTDGDGADDTTTDSDGVPVLSISDSEVPRVDADNITVNPTAR